MIEAGPLITDSRHPLYSLADYIKFRLTYMGGRVFIDTYLQKYEAREDTNDFKRRRLMTHNPGFAAQALDEIIAGITQRMPEIIRVGGTKSYTNSLTGIDGGVDLENSSMNTFQTQKVLPELLSLGRVGVYVDMPKFNPYSTLADFAVLPHPYLYYYRSEDILSWNFQFLDNRMQLTAVLLRECHWNYNAAGLPTQQIERFRLIRLTNQGVLLQFFEQGVSLEGKKIENVVAEFLLPLKRLPFVMFDIGKSLLTDAADIQIGLLNLASADLAYAFNSNFPLYVEGYDPKTENLFGKRGANVSFDSEGNATTTTNPVEGTSPEIIVGTMHGRRFPFEAPVPAFIHPSPEPLRVSMDKQEAMKSDIRRLLNLNVSNVAPSRSSAESKKIDQSAGLESGLARIGIELEGGERELAQIWAEYEGESVSKTLSVSYPTTFSLKTDEQRIAEAKSLQEVQGAAPSRTFQKEVSKLAAKSILDGKVNQGVMTKIASEIDSADYITGDWKAVQADFEIGIVDSKTAAEARGYDPLKVEIAQQERTKRMADIAAAQSVGAANSAARGGEGPPNAKMEKTTSQSADNNLTGKAVRG